LLTGEIIGKEIIESQGFRLGKVADVQFDEKNWKIIGLEIELDKEIAEEHQLYHRLRKTRVMVHVEHIQAVGDRVILKGLKEDLMNLIVSVASNEPEETAH
jgi:sporulation protein YlmC with PRC-barrel domain